MKQREPGGPPTGNDDKVHELVDIIAEEVSDVDRAANRRTYLVVKREDEREPATDDSKVEDLVILDGLDDDDEAFVLFDKAEAEGGEAAPALAHKQTFVLAPAAKTLLLRHLGQALEELTALVTSIRDAEEGESAAVPAELVQGLRRVCDRLGALLGRGAASKAGAKMASQRRRQLEDAIALLQKLLAEVMPHLDATGVGKAAAGSQVAAEPPSAPDSATEQTSLLDVLATVTTGIGALTERLKRQEATLAQLAKATGLPASREVEAVRAPTRPQGDEWPLDMNAPVSRDRVPKEISFFDI